MRIIELEIQGFRSLKNTSWRPGDLNIIIGRNASGKSNLLRFIELVSASAKGGLADYVSSSGGMNSILWDGRAANINFRLKTSSLDLPFYRGDPGLYSLTYDATLAQIGKTSSYRVQEEQLANYEQMSLRGKSESFRLLERHNLSGRLFDEEERYSLTASEETMSEEETLLSLTASPFLDKKYQQVTLYREQLRDWTVYQDIRTDRQSKMRQEAEVKGVKQVASDGQNLVNVIHTLYESADDPDFKENLDDGMRAAFGDDFKELKFSPDADGRIQLGVRWNSLKRVNSAAVLSDGTLRFLFLLTVLGNPSPASLIAIDEPEAGLHPSMLPIVAEYAVDAAKRTQVVFTTHSPQFLSAFDKDSRPTTTVTSRVDGETLFQNLNEERLEYWLQQYTLGELLSSGELENLAADALEKVP